MQKFDRKNVVRQGKMDRHSPDGRSAHAAASGATRQRCSALSRSLQAALRLGDEGLSAATAAAAAGEAAHAASAPSAVAKESDRKSVV